MVMVASLSKSLKLCHLLPTSRLLNCRLTAVSISNASLSSSSLPQLNPSSLFLSCFQIFVNKWMSSGKTVKERGKFYKVRLFVPGAILFGIGTWQLMFAYHRAKLLDEREEKSKMEPVTWAELPFSSNSMDSLYYRRIECEGDFDEKKSIFIGPYSATVSGSGEKVTRYDVITPFIPRKLAPGGVQTPVLVHRGWVPQEWHEKIMSGEEDLDKASSSSLASNTKDKKTASWRNILSKILFHTAKETAVAPPTVKITGIIMKSVKLHMFLKPNDLEGGQWYHTDVPMMVRACGLSENAIDTIYIAEIKEEYTSGAKSPSYPVPHDIRSVAAAGFKMTLEDMANSFKNMLGGSLIATCWAVWKVRKMKAKV